MTFLSRIRDKALGQSEVVTHHSVLSELTLCNHVLVEGAANTGVARLVEDALIDQTANGRGWIFIDTTPDEGLRNRLALAAEKAGRADEFYVLDLQNPEESAELDVFRGTHPFDRADRVLTVLPAAHSDSYGPLLHLLARLFELADSNERTLGARHLSSLLTHLNEPETRERLLGLLPTKDTHFREHVLLPFESPQGEATQAAMALGAQLAALANAGWDQVINAEHPDLDFGNVLAFNKMCLIRVPLQHAVQTQVGLKIIWKQICSSLNARRHTPAREKHDFLLAIEGYPAIHEQTVERGMVFRFDIAREFGVGLMLVGREGSLARYREAYGEGATSLVSNFGTKLYFRQEHLDSRLEDYLSPAQIRALGGLRELRPDQYILCINDKVVSGQMKQRNTTDNLSPYQRFEHERFQFRPYFDELVA